MKGDKITLSQRQLQRVRVMSLVEAGKITLREAADKIGRSYAKARVEVRQLLNGSWKVYYQDRLIARHPSTALREPIRALRRSRSQAPKVKSYNWVYQASAQPIHDKPFG